MARRDPELSHRGEGVCGAMAVAAMGAAIAGGASIRDAVDAGLGVIPAHPDCAAAMRLGLSQPDAERGPDEIHDRYRTLLPVHTVAAHG